MSLLGAIQSLLRPRRARSRALSPAKNIDRNSIPRDQTIGLIAGNGTLPLRFCEAAKRYDCSVVAIAHLDETDSALSTHVSAIQWIKVGQLGAIIDFFKKQGIRRAAMVGGINRVRLFGGVKLDLRGAALLMKLRSAKDDVIMRGIADELEDEGIEVIDSTVFMPELFAAEGVLTKNHPTPEEWADIEVGTRALHAMSAEDIGQLVVVREGVIVAVEAVEGSDAAIQRGGALAGPGVVVVKFAKPTQDMRFDVPTIGRKTIDSLIAAKARVLAIESGRCIIVDEHDVFEAADRNGISIVGCRPLVHSRSVQLQTSSESIRDA